MEDFIIIGILLVAPLSLLVASFFEWLECKRIQKEIDKIKEGDIRLKKED